MADESGTSLPLPTLLSHALTAFTIEFDNEFERQLLEPSGLTFAEWKSLRNSPFLISLGGWAQYMRHIAEDGVTAGELAAHARVSDARLKSSLFNLTRWGYATIEPAVNLRKTIPPHSAVVRPTNTGQHCRKLWDPLTKLISDRWQERFGEEQISLLRQQCHDIACQLDPHLPDYLPIVSSRHRSMPFCSEISPPAGSCAPTEEREDEEVPLYVMFVHLLLTFTLDFERDSRIALIPLANFIRVLDVEGTSLVELPHMAGISEAAVKQGVTFLTRDGFGVVEQGAQGKQMRLTQKGTDARNAYLRRVNETEKDWMKRFGTITVAKLCDSLNQLVGTRDLTASPLAAGLVPHETVWRASVPQPGTLPEQPMMIGRGWWPDGA